MTWGGDDDERAGSGLDPIALGKWTRAAGRLGGILRTAELRPASDQGGDTGQMVRMPVGNQHRLERGAVKGAFDARDVRRMPDTGIDQHRVLPGEQVGVVAGRARPVRRVVGGEREHGRHVGGRIADSGQRVYPLRPCQPLDLRAQFRHLGPMATSVQIFGKDT